MIQLQRNIDVLVENAFDELLSAVDTIIGSRRRGKSVFGKHMGP